ncbi:MAG: AI-2E family transporter [Oscillospiraceae bacterium]
MRKRLNGRYLTISAYAAGTLIVVAIATAMIINFDKVMAYLGVVGTVLTPIIIGIFCAYLLNPLMDYIEKTLFKKWVNNPQRKSTARGLSLTITMITVVVFLVLLVVMIIPQLVSNVIKIFENMDSYIATVKSFIDEQFAGNPTMRDFLRTPLDDFGAFVQGIWNEYSKELMGFAGNLANSLWALLDAMKNLLLGLIISIYLLAKKEMFISQAKKLLFAFFKVDRAQRILHICREASKKFLGSIIGKILEALIVAMICFVGCTILQLPYSLLISAIMFVFNLIPFIGPTIGCIPCALLLVLSDKPITALWFLIFILILQNIDGNIIAPWILGDKTGLPAVWIVISILVGGGFFGMLGMFLGVPVCAVIYMLFKDFVEERLHKRDLPEETLDYLGNTDYITADYKHSEHEVESEPDNITFTQKKRVSLTKRIFDLLKKLVAKLISAINKLFSKK